jgi:hypothetical protein
MGRAERNPSKGSRGRMGRAERNPSKGSRGRGFEGERVKGKEDWKIRGLED